MRNWQAFDPRTHCDHDLICRYVIGFRLDDGDVWPVAYALKEWSPVAAKKVAELVKAAIS